MAKKFSTEDLLADIAASSASHSDEIMPVVEEVEKPEVETLEVETPEVETPEVEEEVTKESETEKPEEAETVIEEEAQSVKPDDVDSVIESWDDSAPEVEEDVDITSVLSDVGIEASTKDGAKEYVQNLKSQVEQLQAKTNSLDKLPKELVDAIDIANQGGDYLDYLNVTKTDYSKFDPTDVWLYDKSQYFIDPVSKQVDEEKLNEYAEKIGADQIRIEGTQIRNELVKQKDDDGKALLDEAKKKKRKDDETLKEVISKTDSISNYKLSSSHKQGLYTDISSGKLMQDLYYTNGELDFEKMVINGFKAKYFDKINTSNSKSAATQKEKKVIKELANVEVKPPAEKPVTEEKPEQSGLDLLMGNLKEKDRNRKIF